MHSSFSPTAPVQTAQGLLCGTLDSRTGLRSYLGIPYAQPPVGALRFRPPQPAAPWHGVRQANAFGHAAPQLFDPSEGEYHEFADEPPVPGKHWVGNEDCLTLNIWARADGAARKPVLVWIHGGANWLESSRLHCYHGDHLAHSGDVVFVSLNYRLGLFGFLDISVLGGEAYAGSHSHGLLDQRQALQWIHANIEQFGGDPQNITLMGESAGSIDISWHLAGGHLQGLVKRVVMMSGYAGLPGLSGDIGYGLSDASARDLAQQFFADCAIESLQQLRELSTAQLMDKLAALSAKADMLFHMDSLFWPKAHALSAPQDPITFAEQGEATGIDIVIGFTNYEMGLWLNWDEQLDSLGLDAVVERLAIASELKEPLKALYRSELPTETDGQQAMHLLGDSAFVMPSLWAAEHLCRRNRVKVYRFDRHTDARRRAQHAADQVYFFGKLDTYVGKHLAGETGEPAEQRERQALQQLMQGIVLGYARNGEPAGPQWLDYKVAGRALLTLDAEPALLSDPYGKRRAWWFEHVYLKRFAHLAKTPAPSR